MFAAVYLYIENCALEILLIIMRIACDSPTLPRLNCLYKHLNHKVIINALESHMLYLRKFLNVNLHGSYLASLYSTRILTLE